MVVAAVKHQMKSHVSMYEWRWGARYWWKILESLIFEKQACQQQKIKKIISIAFSLKSLGYFSYDPPVSSFRLRLFRNLENLDWIERMNVMKKFRKK
mmetsp:Transcript_8406/g.20672  ORF Transcript_8406/g.20672 Transcript_8406/m.20672 type:complete len:97 (+) Transcript_8406:78-368(+)